MAAMALPIRPSLVFGQSPSELKARFETFLTKSIDEYVSSLDVLVKQRQYTSVKRKEANDRVIAAAQRVSEELARLLRDVLDDIEVAIENTQKRTIREADKKVIPKLLHYVTSHGFYIFISFNANYSDKIIYMRGQKIIKPFHVPVGEQQWQSRTYLVENIRPARYGAQGPVSGAVIAGGYDNGADFTVVDHDVLTGYARVVDKVRTTRVTRMLSMLRSLTPDQATALAQKFNDLVVEFILRDFPLNVTVDTIADTLIRLTAVKEGRLRLDTEMISKHDLILKETVMEQRGFLEKLASGIVPGFTLADVGENVFLLLGRKTYHISLWGIYGDLVEAGIRARELPAESAIDRRTISMQQMYDAVQTLGKKLSWEQLAKHSRAILHGNDQAIENEIKRRSLQQSGPEGSSSLKEVY